MNKPIAEEKVVPASHDTRCRYCWARISRGTDSTEVYHVYFHVECPKKITDFPVIGSIDEHGQDVPGKARDVPDDPYARLRADREAGLV